MQAALARAQAVGVTPDEAARSSRIFHATLVRMQADAEPSASEPSEPIFPVDLMTVFFALHTGRLWSNDHLRMAFRAFCVMRGTALPVSSLASLQWKDTTFRWQRGARSSTSFRTSVLHGLTANNGEPAFDKELVASFEADRPVMPDGWFLTCHIDLAFGEAKSTHTFSTDKFLVLTMSSKQLDWIIDPVWNLYQMVFECGALDLSRPFAHDFEFRATDAPPNTCNVQDSLTDRREEIAQEFTAFDAFAVYPQHSRADYQQAKYISTAEVDADSQYSQMVKKGDAKGITEDEYVQKAAAAAIARWPAVWEKMQSDNAPEMDAFAAKAAKSYVFFGSECRQEPGPCRGTAVGQKILDLLSPVFSTLGRSSVSCHSCRSGYIMAESIAIMQQYGREPRPNELEDIWNRSGQTQHVEHAYDVGNSELKVYIRAAVKLVGSAMFAANRVVSTLATTRQTIATTPTLVREPTPVGVHRKRTSSSRRQIGANKKARRGEKNESQGDDEEEKKVNDEKEAH